MKMPEWLALGRRFPTKELWALIWLFCLVGGVIRPTRWDVVLLALYPVMMGESKEATDGR